MSLGPGSLPRPGPRLLLLGLLLLPAARGGRPTVAEDRQCVCLRTTPRVHPERVASLEVMRPGPHCPAAQMLATLRSGRKVCLDPHARAYKRILRELTGRRLAAH